MRTLLVVLLCLIPLTAQEKGGDGKRGARQPPKNLKVLKIPQEELIPVMRSYTTALGVKCDFCHVQGDFASDEKHQKEVARMMIVMNQEINAKFPDGKAHVACYTCHRGENEPKMAAPAAN